MKIEGSVALVTGAGRGLGRVYAWELVSRGAARVYGAARDPAAVTEPGVTPVALDITDPERVAGVAEQCADVSLLVNIGYLDIRRVAVPAFAGPAITAAMELVAGTCALIIDLRRNGGGSPEGVAFWCSYLLPEPTHLNDIFDAGTGETRQFWSLDYVPGTRYLDRPVYLLTSSRTFSGGEDFSYTLQALGRGVVIGETTGGGAHPARGFPISAAVHIAIPFARSVSPVTGTNWEGTGVVPDIAVPQAEARDVAYGRALRHVLSIDVPPPIADEARDALAALPAQH